METVGQSLKRLPDVFRESPDGKFKYDIVSSKTAVEELSEVHAVAPQEMARLHRRAYRNPPTQINYLEAAKKNPKYLEYLSQCEETTRATIDAAAEASAFMVTHIHAVRLERPSMVTANSWVTDSRLKRFSESFDPFESGGAIVVGPTGIGKSVACFCLMRRAIRDGYLKTYEAQFDKPYLEERELLQDRYNLPSPTHYSLPWASFEALQLGLMMQRTELGKNEPDDITNAKTRKCLVLDDLGWEKPFHVDTIMEVAAARYDAGLPTLVTSGKTYQELRDRYGDALLRRFINIKGKPGAVIDCWKKP